MLEVNMNKSKALVFEEMGWPLCNISLIGEDLEAVDEFGYLGVKFSKDVMGKLKLKVGLYNGGKLEEH